MTSSEKKSKKTIEEDQLETFKYQHGKNKVSDVLKLRIGIAFHFDF